MALEVVIGPSMTTGFAMRGNGASMNYQFFFRPTCAAREVKEICRKLGVDVQFLLGDVQPGAMGGSLLST
ncbi:MAG: hypothetical protein IMF26_04645 [Candidatus Fermentithermobacillus carboniphilus]|uniref:Uncharacterized protein n=1 Tax=Candidatus Fermentithermobacillus carboniphilus TaxID=3085328 RepID=A0AAT9LFJ0_9FIRM|nr:MAG: hypothetical protein IMF26_04645 [Candidatus Fermentithermobacillus carboniphilus]